MKMKQLLPIALVAAMITSASYAEETAVPSAKATSASQELELTVPSFFNVWVKDATSTSTIEPDAAYKTFTNPALSVKYGVITNTMNDKVILTATSSRGSGESATTFNAFRGTENKLRIAFVNSKANLARIVNQAAVTAALDSDVTGSKVEDHPNVIALNIATATATDVTEGVTSESPGHAPTPAYDTDKVTYTLYPGTYEFYYVTAGGDNTSLSSHDEEGTYKATLTMTRGASI